MARRGAYPGIESVINPILSKCIWSRISHGITHYIDYSEWDGSKIQEVIARSPKNQQEPAKTYECKNARPPAPPPTGRRRRTAPRRASDRTRIGQGHPRESTHDRMLHLQFRCSSPSRQAGGGGMAAAVQRRCGSGMRSSHGPRRTDGLDATVVRLDEDSRDEDIRQLDLT